MRHIPDKIEIQMTQKDIKYGKRQNACWCPTAMAILRTLKTLEINSAAVWVYYHEITIIETISGETKKFNMPQSVSTFISKFDDKDNVDRKSDPVPITFTLENPS